ncbi:HI0074 family nucleotidyltransferase substrate-binding subunit [Oscillospiraceae bacterium PP1C4]
MSLDEKTKILVPAIVSIGKRYSVTKIILFGSRARGDNTSKSDIDLAVYGASNEALFNAEIDELDTLLKFDIVHIADNTSPALINNIKKDGIVLMDKLSTKLNNFTSALARLKEACEEYRATNSQVVRDGVIQRFEFTTELAWKATREYLLDQGYTDVNSPKAVMKVAFSEGLVEDDIGWVELLNARNTTSHVYDEQQAEKIYNDIAEKYIFLFEGLNAKLANLCRN